MGGRLVQAIVERSLETAGQVVGPALAKAVFGHGRCARKIVLPIEDEGLGRVLRVQGRDLAQDGGLGNVLAGVGRQDTAAGLPVVHPVDLGAAQAQQFGQPVGRIPQTAKVTFVHHAGPVGDYYGAALCSKITDGACKIFPQQVDHGQHHQAIALQAAVLVDEIYGNAGTGQGVVMERQFLPIAHPCIAGAGGTLDGPHIVPVVDDGRLFGPLGASSQGDRLQSGAHLHRLPVGAAVGAAVMADHRTVEFFLGAPACPPLEITDAVGAVGHRLQGRQHGDARFFLFAHRLPVGAAGGGLHQQKGLPFQGIEQVVHHRRVKGGLLHRLGGLVPGGVTVPADHIQLPAQLKVVDVVEAVHQVGGELCLRGQLPHAVPLKLEKVDVPAADKTLPAQGQALDGVLPLGRGAFDLVPAGIIVAPEAGVPGFVQGFQGAVAAPEPLAERLLAELAVAFAPHLVGDMPQDDCRVRPEAGGQLPVDGAHLFPVEGRGIAVVLPPAVQLAGPVGPHPAHFGVLVSHPGRAGRAGGGQDGGNAAGIQPVDDVGQPVQVIDAFLRLQKGPGKHPQGHGIDMRLLHQLDILLQDVRPVQPLFRVIVPAIKKFALLH